VDALDVVWRDAANGPNGRIVTCIFKYRGDESGRASLAELRSLSAFRSTPATLHAIDPTVQFGAPHDSLLEFLEVPAGRNRRFSKPLTFVATALSKVRAILRQLSKLPTKPLVRRVIAAGDVLLSLGCLLPDGIRCDQSATARIRID
jgi:hypothetical protein